MKTDPSSRTEVACTVLRGTKAEDFLAVRWPDLYRADQHATPFQSAGWYTGWLRTVGATRAVTPMVYAVTLDGELVTALAMQEETEAGVHTVSALTTPWSDYVRPVGPRAEDPVAGRALVDALSRYVAGQGKLVIEELPPDTALTQVLQSDSRWEGGPCSSTAQLRLPGGWADLPTKGEYGYKLRRLRARGALCCVHSTDRPSLLAGLDELVALHIEQWRDRADVVAPFTDPVIRIGYTDLAAQMDPSEMVVSRLTLDGRTLAAYLGFRRQDTYYAYRPAMDVRERRDSPGHLLLLHMLRDFAAAGLTVFDLTRGEYAYKGAYADGWRDNHGYRLEAARC